MVWLDQRQAKKLPKVANYWRAAFKLIGLDETIRYFQGQAECNWLAENEPDLWQKTDKYLFLSGFLIRRMVGEFVDSVGSTVGYVPLNYKKQVWASAWDWKWQALTIRPEQLPRLVKPSELLGTLQADAARELGLPVGLKIIAAASDKACEVLGSGCITPDVACLSFGTSATINVTHPKYLEPIRHLPAYPAALPNAFSTEIQIYRGFWMVSWFREQFAHLEQQRAAHDGVPVESLFDELVKDAPPGAMGLMLQPYWSPGVRDPGPEAKGAIIGFGDVHTRAHLYRAILEGLAYGLRQGREYIEKRGGIPIQKIRIAGGGSQSDSAMQIAANIFNLPAARPHLYEASGLGAAINLAVGVGVYANYPEAIAKMTREGKVFYPQPDQVKIYEGLYRRVYLKMYGRLQPLYQAIREITGYPA